MSNPLPRMGLPESEWMHEYDEPARRGEHVHEHYDSARQQEYAAKLGMWTFLATEVLFFGGLILAFVAYRYLYTDSFTEGAKEMEVNIGTINTAILLTSSLTMALSVETAKTAKRPRLLAGLLTLTAALGAAFLCLKGFEYYNHVQDHKLPGPGFFAAKPHPERIELFYYLYFAATGLHALHLTIGCLVVLVMALRARKSRFSPEYYTPIEITGLYWHFIDIVWVFLFPLFYLLGQSK